MYTFKILRSRQLLCFRDECMGAREFLMVIDSSDRGAKIVDLYLPRVDN